jgi:hypothetical protein
MGILVAIGIFICWPTVISIVPAVLSPIGKFGNYIAISLVT